MKVLSFPRKFQRQNPFRPGGCPGSSGIIRDSPGGNYFAREVLPAGASGVPEGAGVGLELVELPGEAAAVLVEDVDLEADAPGAAPGGLGPGDAGGAVVESLARHLEGEPHAGAGLGGGGEAADGDVEAAGRDVLGLDGGVLPGRGLDGDGGGVAGGGWGGCLVGPGGGAGGGPRGGDEGRGRRGL